VCPKTTPRRTEARRPAQRLIEPIQTRLWGDLGPLGQLSDGVDLGDLIQSQRAKRAFGEGDVLLLAVVNHHEDRGWEGDDSRRAHAVRRGDPPQRHFDQRRLLAACQIRLGRPEHELEQQSSLGDLRRLLRSVIGRRRSGH